MSKRPTDHVTWELRVHPAAEMFPLMSPSALRELADDIKKNGLQNRVTFMKDRDGLPVLLDGRSRLDALDLLGHTLDFDKMMRLVPADTDPYAFVISANIHRRHLSAKQKRDLIETLLKARPEQSDRQVADQT